MDVYGKLEEMGLKLPPAPPAGGVYAPMREFGDNLAYTSGIGPVAPDGTALFCGKLGSELSIEEGKKAARQSTLNMLGMLHHQLGDLNRIEKIVKLLGFVACENDFYSQPAVMNGSTELLIELFGEEAGRPARSAIGTNALPGNIPVEIELVVQLKKE